MPPVNTIVNADCISAMQDLPDGYVDLAFADPPFNIGYDYDVYDDRKERDEYLAWSKRWIAQVYRVLKSSGTFWLAIGDEYAAELKIAAQDAGFHCRSWVVWYYTFGVNCTRKFSRSHAHLFHFIKDAQNFTFNPDAIRVPSARQLVYNDGRANPKGRLPDDTWILRPQDCPSGFGADEDTWYFPRVAGTFKERAGFHGCQMPEQLLGRIIRCCSNEDELVMDPFSGSATTVAVAKKLGRRYLGFDLSQEYAARGLQRLDTISSGDPLVGADDPLTSAPATVDGRPPRPTTRRRALRSVAAEAGRSVSDQKYLVDIERIVCEAFRKVHSGFSVDYLMANPELNAAFVDACRKQGIPATASAFNRTLLQVRKSGRLCVATSRKIHVPRHEMESFIFASEIAMRQLQVEGHTLDEVLCAPALADRFDAIAARFASGYSSFQYRWSALRVRKSYRDKEKQLEALDGRTKRRKSDDVVALPDLKFDRVPPEPGVYRIYDPPFGELFIGETNNLRERLAAQFNEIGRSAWQTNVSPCSEVALFPGMTGRIRDGFHLHLVQTLEPLHNYRRIEDSTGALTVST